MPQIASAKLPAIEETPLQPPVPPTAPGALETLEKQRVGELARLVPAAQKLRPYKLEISNGNGTAGLARRVARLLDQKGVRANRITNHGSFHQSITQIEYRAGYRTEASRVGAFFPAEMKAVASSSLRKDIHVRVLLGKDVASMTALPSQAAHAVLTAHARDPQRN